MPAESGDRKMAPAPEQEQIPCPRCDSPNTKFCYYNNYNFSQPRHFCKSCRRYWTQGGTLRDIPVGGGTRKGAKRSRARSRAAVGTTAESSPPVDPNPAGNFFAGDGYSKPGAASGGPLGLVPTVAGSFTSLLNASATVGSGGLLALNGMGLGIGPGFDESGFGPVGRPIWAFPEFGCLGGGHGAVMRTVGNVATWQRESGGDEVHSGGAGGGVFVGGECFSSWPELAISTPGNGLK